MTMLGSDKRCIGIRVVATQSSKPVTSVTSLAIVLRQHAVRGPTSELQISLVPDIAAALAAVEIGGELNAKMERASSRASISMTRPAQLKIRIHRDGS
jgi:hypothetical protein